MVLLVATLHLLGTPNIQNLGSLGGIEIIRETASSFNKIGSILLDDQYGHRVESLQGTEEEKMATIYKEWLQNEKYPSWETLRDCFRQCQLHDLAGRIEKHVGIPSPPTTPGILHNS